MGVVLSIIDPFVRVLVRAPSHFVHGLLPASCLSANRYNLDDVVAALGRELDLINPLKRVQLSSFGDELLKLDQVHSGGEHLAYLKCNGHHAHSFFFLSLTVELCCV